MNIQMNYKEILAKNVTALMDRDEVLNSHAKIAKRCKRTSREISARAIGYMLDTADDRQPKLDTIVAVAEAFKVAPWLLLTPDFDPDKKTGGDLPPPEVIRLALRIHTMPEPERILLMKIFSKDATDERTESARSSMMVRQPTKNADYARAAKRRR